MHHGLQIETGRYNIVLCQQRLCISCDNIENDYFLIRVVVLDVWPSY